MGMDLFDPQPLPGRPKKRKIKDSYDKPSTCQGGGERFASVEISQPNGEEAAAFAALDDIVAQYGAITNFEAAAVFMYAFTSVVPEARRDTAYIAGSQLCNQVLAWATTLLQKSNLTP